jgi:hypothetical protein
MRDTKGRPVAPDKDEKVKGRVSDSEEKSGGADGVGDHLASCQDCMKTVQAHMGIAKPADGMKGQDQGGKAGNPAKGHDRTPTARQRH